MEHAVAVTANAREINNGVHMASPLSLLPRPQFNPAIWLCKHTLPALSYFGTGPFHFPGWVK